MTLKKEHKIKLHFHIITESAVYDESSEQSSFLLAVGTNHDRLSMCIKIAMHCTTLQFTGIGFY